MCDSVIGSNSAVGGASKKLPNNGILYLYSINLIYARKSFLLIPPIGLRSALEQSYLVK